MLQVCLYDPADRHREKERSRAADEADLRSGSVSRGEMSARNGFFSSLHVVESSVICQDVFA